MEWRGTSPDNPHERRSGRRVCPQAAPKPQAKCSKTPTQPRDQGVGVPHLACGALVTSPDEWRHGRHEIEKAPPERGVTRQQPGAVDRFADIGDHAVPPATDLVAKHPEASDPAASDGTLDHHAAGEPVAVAHGRLLDDEPPFRHAHHERRVVEIKRRPALGTRCHSLVDTPVQPHGVPTGAEREPVELDAVGPQIFHCARNVDGLMPGAGWAPGITRAVTSRTRCGLRLFPLRRRRLPR